MSVKNGSLISKIFIFKFEKYLTNSSFTFPLSKIEVLIANFAPEHIDISNLSPVSG